MLESLFVPCGSICLASLQELSHGLQGPDTTCRNSATGLAQCCTRAINKWIVRCCFLQLIAVCCFVQLYTVHWRTVQCSAMCAVREWWGSSQLTALQLRSDQARWFAGGRGIRPSLLGQDSRGIAASDGLHKQAIAARSVMRMGK